MTLAAAGGPVRRGSVNHTFAGARFALERWHNSAQPTCQSMTAELLAFAVAAHHGQFDCIAPDGTDGFLHRLMTEGTGYAQAREQFLVHCADAQALDCLFDAATSEVAAALERCRPFAENAEELLFYFALLARQLLSAVIEGDRRDTAEFMHALPFSAREADTQADWRGLLARVEALARRVERMQAGRDDTAPPDDGRLVSGCFVLDQRSRILYKNDTAIDLTQVEFQIMELLFANPGVALVREKILEGVWGDNYFGDVKIVDVNIRRLRMKIENEPSSPKHILTVWGYGYRWNA
ncbi:MAG: winged helix-turn-helix domain-containing protein [Ruthenibacterium sp.]